MAQSFKCVGSPTLAESTRDILNRKISYVIIKLYYRAMKQKSDMFQGRN